MNILTTEEEMIYIKSKYHLSLDKKSIYSNSTNKLVKLKGKNTISLYSKKEKKLTYIVYYICSMLFTEKYNVPKDICESFRDRFFLMDDGTINRKNDNHVMNNSHQSLKLSFKGKTVRVPYFIAVNILNGHDNVLFDLAKKIELNLNENENKGNQERHIKRVNVHSKLHKETDTYISLEDEFNYKMIHPKSSYEAGFVFLERNLAAISKLL